MKNYIHIALMGSLLLSCDANSNAIETNFDADCLRIPNSKKESYFPEKVFDDSTSYEGKTKFLSNWYSKHLFSMNEPIIYECTETSESYRFTWLRTFHEPIAVRITRTKDKIKLYWTKTNGAGGYNAGKIIEQGDKEISINDFNEFKSKLDSCKFFNMATNEETMGLDGAKWILEGINGDNEYHLVDRWNAKENPFGKACLFLVELTELKIDKELIY